MLSIISLLTSSSSSSLRGLTVEQPSAFHAPTSWGYENIAHLNQAGPEHWHLVAGAMACEAAASASSAQSPINVTPEAVIVAPWLPALKLGGGYISENSKMQAFGDGSAPAWVNNGHTVELGPNHLASAHVADEKDVSRHLSKYTAVNGVAASSAAMKQAKALSADPTSENAALKEEHYQAQQAHVNPRVGSIDIGGLSSLNFQGPTLAANSTDEGWNEMETVYDLLQLHLHWGKDENEGSEHSIAGRAHPLEMHLVHTQRGNPYPTRSPGGLAVVSVMFQVGAANPTLEHVTSQIKAKKLGEVGSSVPAASNFDVRSLLPNGFESNYLTYKGSLTTPGCFQSVNWIIAGKTLTVSQEQLDALRSIDSLEAGVPLTQNFRPVQPRNGRVVWMKGDAAFSNLAGE